MHYIYCSPKLGELSEGLRGLIIPNPPIGYPKVNQDNVCLLLGKRRYELLSMIEQSDIIRATSSPNANSKLEKPVLYLCYTLAIP